MAITKEYFSIPEVLEQARYEGKSITARTLSQHCRSGLFPHAKKEKGKWLIPLGELWGFLNPEEAAKADAEHEAFKAEYGSAMLMVVQKKIGLIQRFYRFVRKFREEGQSKRMAKALAISQIRFDRGFSSGKPGQFSERTLQRWERQLRLHGLKGLIDKRIWGPKGSDLIGLGPSDFSLELTRKYGLKDPE